MSSRAPSQAAGEPRLLAQPGASLEALHGHWVAVIGYGRLGRSIALNLRASGVNVLIGSVRDACWDQAVADGFRPLSPGDATAQAYEVFVLLPDEVIPAVFAGEIAPRLQPGGAVCFASGYVLAYGLITVPPGVDVLLIAPRMAGAQVRQAYLDGTGFYSCVSAEVDATGRARARLLALAAAIGSLRRGVLELPAEQEALLDLLIEQTFGVYLGLGIQAAFRAGTGAGLPPEALVLELYMSGEMARVIEGFATEGFYASLAGHGLTALYGGFIRTAGVDHEGMERMFRDVLEDIRSGGFAQAFQREQAAGYPSLKAIQEITSGSDPMSAAEARIRAAFDLAPRNAVSRPEEPGPDEAGKLDRVTWRQFRDAYMIARRALYRLSLNDEMAGMGQRDGDPEAIARCRYAARAKAEMEQAVSGRW